MKRLSIVLSCLAFMLSIFGTPDIMAYSNYYGVIIWTQSGGQAYIEGVTDKNVTSLRIPSEFPGTYVNYPVVSIEEEAFMGCSNLISVTVPQTVHVSRGAFKGCRKLESIDFPSVNKYVLNECFYNCEKLKQVTLPDGLISIFPLAFYNCSSLSQITFPESLEKIDDQAFENCTHLTKVVLPDNVTEIGFKAFNNCTAILDFTIGKSVKKIGTDAVNFMDDLYCYATELPETNYFSLPETGGRYLYIPLDSHKEYMENRNWARFRNYFPIEGVNLEVDENSEVYTEDGISYRQNTDGASWSVVSVDKEATAAYILKVIDGKPVMGASSGAFKGCSNLKTVSFPPTLVSVGEGCFEGCESLSDIYCMTPICPVLHEDIFKSDNKNITLNIPEGTTKLYSGVWPENIHDIKESDFTSTVIDGILYDVDPSDESAPAYASAGVPSISKLNIRTDVNIFGIKYKVAGIKESGFMGCQDLKEVDIEPGIDIPLTAFKECPSINTIKIGVENTVYFPYLFESSFDIREVSFYDDGQPVMIPEEFLKDRKYLASFTFPVNTTFIYDDAFNGCESLTELDIPETTVFKGNRLFKGCISLEKVNIPSATEKLGGGTFQGCTSLESIVLPDNMKVLGIAAFKDCTSLKEINFPDNFEDIGSNAFENCTSLERIVLPDNLRFMNSEAFKGCTSLTYIKLPDTYITSVYSGGEIESGLFEGCTSLKEIRLSRGINRIYDSAFKDCTSLDKIEFYTPIKSAGDYAFKNTGFTSARFSALETMGVGCFENCQKLTAISLPSLKTIPDGAFQECPLLEVLDLNDDISKIGKRAFLMCESLPSFTVPSGTESIEDYAFYNCTSLTEINFPSTSKLELIKSDAFSYTGLKEVVFPESLLILGYDVFSFCKSLEKVYFNKDFSELAPCVFQGCDNLLEIYCPSVVPPLWEVYYAQWEYAFSTYDTAKLYVPEESIPLYRSLDGNPNGRCGWYKFKNILPIESAGVDDIEAEEFDSDLPVEIYNTNGVLLYKGIRSEATLPMGIYIIRQGSKVKKVMTDF